ncbi:MAG: hypothetical protein DCC75_11100, partial [Proteobacteria bacterium]
RPNAFALGAQTIALSTGLFNLVNTRDELAFVLAHELGHIALGHSIESPANLSPESQIEQHLKDEIQADRFAVQLMKNAGIAPDSALDLLARLSHGGNKNAKVRTNIYYTLSPRLNALKSLIFQNGNLPAI